MKLKDEIISGVDVEVHVTNYGSFTVTLDGGEIARGDTLGQALQRARPKVAARKLCGRLSGRVAPRSHCRSSPGPASAGWQFSTDIPPETLKRYLALGEEVRERERERRSIEEQYTLNLRAAVEREINAKIEATSEEGKA